MCNVKYCAECRVEEIPGIDWIFLPRPWLNVDASQGARDRELECECVWRAGNDIFARGRVRVGDRLVRLPYWHKAVRV
jgi:hypothetical protein